MCLGFYVFVCVFVYGFVFVVEQWVLETLPSGKWGLVTW